MADMIVLRPESVHISRLSAGEINLDWRLRLLERDAPEHAAAYRRGEYSSVRQALQAARGQLQLEPKGPPRRVTDPPLSGRYNPEERQRAADARFVAAGLRGLPEAEVTARLARAPEGYRAQVMEILRWC